MKVLQLTAHFRPNIGGVETHLEDLCQALTKRGFDIFVLTYRPLQTQVKWKIYEKEKNIEILRMPWIPNLFYKLIESPILELVYLLPGLFLITPLVLLLKNPEVIHAHGLVAGFVGVFWGKLFGKRVVISTHSIYSFPKKGMYKNFASWIFKNADYCLGLSKQSENEILSLGLNKLKVNHFTYWIDLNNFQRIKNAKIKLGWKEGFVVLFVGRLVQEKGVIVLVEAAKNWDKNINLKIIGSGPLEYLIGDKISEFKNIEYLGPISQSELPIYYSGSDILVVPSLSQEGFGRVILESLACGTPIIGANIGAIPEAIDKTVGTLIDVSTENIKQFIEYFYEHRDKLTMLSENCRNFAERKYSEKNVETIIRAYKG